MVYSFYILFLLITHSILAQKSDRLSFRADELKRIIIMDDGRKKPLDTYAENLLLSYSGRKRYHSRPAVEWLAKVLFAPQYAADDTVFLINNPQIADALGIIPQKKRRYCFSQLHTGIEKLDILYKQAKEKKKENYTIFENEIIRLHSIIDDYQQLSSTFNFLSPCFEIKEDVPGLKETLCIDAKKNTLSYLEILERNHLISSVLISIQKKQRSEWTLYDHYILRIAHAIFTRQHTGHSAYPFNIIPIVENNNEIWLCPWGFLNKYSVHCLNSAEIRYFKALYDAYNKKDQSGFNNAVNDYCAYCRIRYSNIIKYQDPGIELLYNRINPFFWSIVLCGITLLFSCILLTFSINKQLYIISIILLIMGFIITGSGIVARMIITGHPPVTTLYETFIFVSWASIALGLLLELFHGKAFGLFAASASGCIFLYFAVNFTGNKDTMGMLAAVLNNRFWLITHIITISLGYCGCCCAGIFGHLYLVQKFFSAQGHDSRKLEAISKMIYGALLFGILFTVTGTLLGGMWADQSWGRFWGWDPKENGALLVILWTAILLHTRKANLIQNFGIATGAVITFITVIFSWIGVNLSGVGMHSYGFTSTGAIIVIFFALFEILFLLITVTGIYIKRKQDSK